MNPNWVRVIVNPQAGSGTAAKKVHGIERAMRRHSFRHEVLLTRARGHATELARAAIADGVDVIAVMGGDGTMNEVAQAFVPRPGDESGSEARGPKGAPLPDLAVIPCGTGGDFRRTLGLSTDLDEAVMRLVHGARRKVDLGVTTLTTQDGRKAEFAFVNIASFGIGGHVDMLVDAIPKWLGGRASFVVATLRAMAVYRNVAVRVKVDGVLWHEGPVFNVAVANGRYFGGGMRVAPHADLSDGILEVVALCNLSLPEVLRLSSTIYRGAHLGQKGVRTTRGRFIETEPVHPWARVYADVDGEALGVLPLEVRVHPGALTFRA